MRNLILAAILPLCVTANKVWIGGASRSFKEGANSPNGITPSTVDGAGLSVYFDHDWDTPTALKYAYTDTVENKTYNVECYCGGTARGDTDANADPCGCDRPSDNLDIYLTKFEALFSGYSSSRYKVMSNGSEVMLAINGTYERGDERVDLTKPIESKAAPSSTPSATSGSEEENDGSLVRASSFLLGAVVLVSSMLI